MTSTNVLVKQKEEIFSIEKPKPANVVCDVKNVFNRWIDHLNRFFSSVDSLLFDLEHLPENWLHQPLVSLLKRRSGEIHKHKKHVWKVGQSIEILWKLQVRYPNCMKSVTTCYYKWKKDWGATEQLWPTNHVIKRTWLFATGPGIFCPWKCNTTLNSYVKIIEYDLFSYIALPSLLFNRFYCSRIKIYIKLDTIAWSV